MASPNLSEIVTTTLRNRSGMLADNISRNNALLARLKEKGRTRPFSGGRTIVEEIQYANNGTYKRYSGYEALNVTPSDVFTAAEFAIRQSAVAISISGLEMLQNRGKEQVIDLLRSRIENAEITITNGLSYDVYSDGTQSGQMGGLQMLVSSSPGSGVVGGIDRNTWQFWRNIKFGAVADGGAAATSSNIQSYMNRLVVQLVRGADGPDLIVADNTFYRMYLESLQSIQRITSTDKAGAGFSSLAYYGSGREVQVVLDGGFQGQAGDGNTFGAGGVGAVGGAPANTLYVLNTKYLSYRPHKDRNCVPLDPDRFSVNQDALVKLVGWAGNLTLSNASLQGVLVA